MNKIRIGDEHLRIEDVIIKQLLTPWGNPDPGHFWARVIGRFSFGWILPLRMLASHRPLPSHYRNKQDEDGPCPPLPGVPTRERCPLRGQGVVASLPAARYPQPSVAALPARLGDILPGDRPCPRRPRREAILRKRLRLQIAIA